MQKPPGTTGKILITGGTSGLGLELVKLFLKKGYEIVATGRNPVTITGYENLFKFYRVDLDDLGQAALMIREICENYQFDIVINNAGVLSPPRFMQTVNDLEYTLQVNFLSHLLINEVILRKNKTGNPITIAAVTSPVYRIAKGDLIVHPMKSGYRPLKAYSGSKLYLALMCNYLPERFPDHKLMCICFDPGTFSSRIYRMQNKTFRILYRIASPFMRSPGKVAGAIAEILSTKDLSNGSIYDYRKKIRSIPQTDESAGEIFWKECYHLIGPFVD